jgi:hypothetical protein
MIDLEQVHLTDRNRNGNQYVTYGPLKKALRVQVPRAAVHQGLRFSFDKYYVDLPVSEEFRKEWYALEAHLGCNKSSIWNDCLCVRVDEHTETFDHKGQLNYYEIKDGSLSGELVVLLEVGMVYEREGTRGLSIRAYQIKVYESAF